MKLHYSLFLILVFFQNGNAQNISVGSIDHNMIEERARNHQLLGKGDSLISFAIRPLALESIDTSKVKYNLIDSVKIKLALLPITLKQQYNTFKKKYKPIR